MTIKSITPKTIEKLNAEIVESLQALADKYNVFIKTGKSKYDTDNYTVSLEVAIKSADGEAQISIVSDFKKYRELYGILPDIGDSFVLEGNRYTVLGLRQSSRKYPIVCQRQDGQKVCIRLVDVNRSFKAMA